MEKKVKLIDVKTLKSCTNIYPIN